MVHELTPSEFVAQRAAGGTAILLDVRESWELDVARLPDTVHIPMAEVPARLAELDRQRDIVVLCRSGGRSLTVARFLDAQGYRSVANLTGGILAWGRELDPTLAAY
jgi:rhodanese-related sulfurtransferase